MSSSQIRDECLAALKERLLERANIIQAHLDDEQAKLHQKQAMFKRQAATLTSTMSSGGSDMAPTEDFDRYTEAALFRIEVLQARRDRHEKMALKKYVELAETLDKDVRLAALRS